MYSTSFSDSVAQNYVNTTKYLEHLKKIFLLASVTFELLCLLMTPAFVYRIRFALAAKPCQYRITKHCCNKFIVKHSHKKVFSIHSLV